MNPTTPASPMPETAPLYQIAIPLHKYSDRSDPEVRVLAGATFDSEEECWGHIYTIRNILDGDDSLRRHETRSGNVFYKGTPRMQLAPQRVGTMRPSRRIG